MPRISRITLLYPLMSALLLLFSQNPCQNHVSDLGKFSSIQVNLLLLLQDCSNLSLSLSLSLFKFNNDTSQTA